MDRMASDETTALETLKILHPIITLSAERLDGLRTQCTTSAEITHQEIRTLEGKLVKHFGDQLIAKKCIAPENLPPDCQGPSLKLWLQVVGVSGRIIQGICGRYVSLESLKDRSEQEIRALMNDYQSNEEETRRLTRALQQLKRYTDSLKQQHDEHGKQVSPSVNPDVTDLYWDSWNLQNEVIATNSSINSVSPHNSRTRATRSSVPSEEYLTHGHGNSGSVSQSSHFCSTTPCTPVTTMAPCSLNSPAFSPGSHPNIYSPTNSSVFSPSSTSPGSYDPGQTPPPTPPVKGDKKFQTTPPAKKKQAIVPTGVSSGSLQPEGFPLTKSKSHESQLASRIDSSSESNLVSLEQLPPKRRERLPTEPGPAGPTTTWDLQYSTGSATSTSNSIFSSGRHAASTSSSLVISSVGGSSLNGTSPLSASPIKSPPSSHVEVVDELDPNRPALQVPKSPRTPTMARSMGHMISHRFSKIFKVATCDYCFKQMIIGLRCKECKFKCHRDCEPKVPPSCGLPTEFIDEFVRQLREGENPGIRNLIPASPNQKWMMNRKITRPPVNMLIQPFPGPDSSSNTSSCNSSTPSSPAPFPTTSSKFHYPEVELDRGVTLETRPFSEVTTDDRTSTEKSNDSDRTISQTSGSGSTDSEKTLALRVDSQDSQISDGESNERTWPRQNSLSNREWDIPFDELKIGDKIGKGHFGTVYRGNWHGDVAIKVLDMSYLDNEKTLEQFKQEVAIFRKTRHENLVLFMGACMKPPRLAIVTSMCKGMSLYTHLHLRKDKFNMNRTAAVAAQITQGMGYLHARGIIHKDLKSKNVFIESQNGKIIITDFGLFSVTKLCQGNRKGDSLSIPPGWLCYLAPELIKCLKPVSKHDNELPFAKTTDIYAFGTVWYELLTGEWPYKGLPAESIIWQVGSGIRQPLPTLFSRDVKDILMSCWSTRPEERVDFTKIQKIVEKLPKKRLARSPSHPIHLSRSAESVF
ncbi:unnamed protein product [Orchesella dallaii]|uniref:Kinase suppressor of Ras 2 n=1 Tax=Orchesella dallaii TaxID=48710 RepID=A0ABP1PMJ4_9HEXA